MAEILRSASLGWSGCDSLTRRGSSLKSGLIVFLAARHPEWIPCRRSRRQVGEETALRGLRLSDCAHLAGVYDGPGDHIHDRRGSPSIDLLRRTAASPRTSMLVADREARAHAQGLLGQASRPTNTTSAKKRSARRSETRGPVQASFIPLQGLRSMSCVTKDSPTTTDVQSRPAPALRRSSPGREAYLARPGGHHPLQDALLQRGSGSDRAPP